jgi:ribosomal protein L11 methyltransferase
MRSWHAVKVTVKPNAAEAVEHAFNVLGSIGTEINNLKKSDTEEVCVVGYFDQPPDDAVVRSALADAFEVFQLGDTAVSIRSETIPETDWLAEWKKHWRPTGVGRFVIAPPWSEVSVSDKIVVRIEPNMAFGTGTHQTTQLCLRTIGEYFRSGMSMLDVGTGTGILAIAAAKLAPSSHIVACDVDTDSINIACENAVANGVANTIEFYEGSIDDGTPMFDFVCANLTLDVITPLLPLLVEKSREFLLLSGILVEQEDSVRNELLKFEISNLEISHAGEWLSVLAEKSS